MSSEVENMMYVNEVPWHGLGKKLQAPPTTREAIVMAGLDWKVNLRPIWTTPSEDMEDGFLQLDHYATVRSDNHKVLGVVGPTYKPLQNEDAFSFFDPFIENGVATLETAGSLREGKRVWILAKVQGDPMEIVKGDAIERFILLSNGHDGSLAIRCGFTPVRVVCANTLGMAHGDKGSKLLRVRHTDKAKSTLEIIQQTMKVVNAEFEATAEQFKTLAKRQVNLDDIKSYVRLVFKPQIVQTIEDANIQLTDKEKDGRADKLLNKIIPLFEHGRGNDMPGVAGTLWGAYNAVTEFTTWERGRTTDTRLDSLWFGDSAQVNTRALSVAMKMVAAA